MDVTSAGKLDVLGDDLHAEPPRSVVRSVSTTHRAAWQDAARGDPGKSPTGDVLQSVQPVVDAVLRRVVGSNDPEYEDLVQSSLENVLVTIDGGRFRGECPPSGLAATIARNVAVDALRARSRERRVFTRDECDQVGVSKVPGAETGPEQLAYMHQQLRRFAGALCRLGAEKAEVVYLHDVLGYDLDEVATRMGTTVAAAQSRLVRGRREVLDWMSLDADDSPRRRGRPRAQNDS